MKTKLQRLAHLSRNGYARAVTMALMAGPVLAQTTDPVETEMTAAKTKVLGYIAIGGAALVVVAVAAVGFGVAVKYIKKLRGAS